MANVPNRPNALFYDEALRSLKRQCSMSRCNEVESATGWVVYDGGIDQLMVEFQCPLHGFAGSWKPEFQSLLEQAMEDARRSGIDIDKLLKQRRARRHTT